MRKLSPFCEKCGSKNKSSLTVDHVIPVSDDATLAYEPFEFAGLLPIMQCEPVNQRHRQ
jgi:5-methylcytosine-specific restriction endonuclease McrA